MIQREITNEPISHRSNTHIPPRESLSPFELTKLDPEASNQSARNFRSRKASVGDGVLCLTPAGVSDPYPYCSGVEKPPRGGGAAARSKRVSSCLRVPRPCNHRHPHQTCSPASPRSSGRILLPSVLRFLPSFHASLSFSLLPSHAISSFTVIDYHLTDLHIVVIFTSMLLNFDYLLLARNNCCDGHDYTLCF